MFVYVRASAPTSINPKSMTGRDRPRSKAYYLDSPLGGTATSYYNNVPQLCLFASCRASSAARDSCT